MPRNGRRNRKPGQRAGEFPSGRTNGGLTDMDAKIQIALNTIKGKFAEALSEWCIADSVHLGRSRFGRLFKRETGQTFKAFLLALRMTKARDMLVLDPTLQVQKVADLVGYRHRRRQAFTRDLRRFWGYPPSQCPKLVAQYQL
jgi:transcriptional regulator GlxA family with amidase domain